MEKNLKSMSISYGIYLSIGLVLLTILSYVFNIEFLLNPWMNLLVLPVTIIGFGVVSSANAKGLLNGFISFKQAFTAYFIPIAIGVSISTLAMVILFNFIDTDSANYLKELLISETQSSMEAMGKSQIEIEEAVTKIKSQDTFALGTQFRALAQRLMFFTVIGLVVALMMKKKDPNEA